MKNNCLKMEKVIILAYKKLGTLYQSSSNFKILYRSLFYLNGRLTLTTLYEEIS